MADGVVLSLGSVNADFQMRVDRRPEPGETHIGHDFARLGGGKAANVALLTQRLDCSAKLIGRVGDDDLADQALGELQRHGVDLSSVLRTRDEETGVAMISVPPDGQKGIIMSPNANAAWPREAREAVLSAVAQAPKGSVLVVDCEVPGDLVLAAMQEAGRRGHACILDPSPVDRISDEHLAASTIVTPNPAEAHALTDEEVDDDASALRAARVICDKGSSFVCVKSPSGGCVVASCDGAHVVRGPSVEPTDTTGAGDAFAGALAVQIMRGSDVPEAVRFAVAAADLAVQAYGAQPSYPGADALRRRTEQVETEHL